MTKETLEAKLDQITQELEHYQHYNQYELDRDGRYNRLMNRLCYLQEELWINHGDTGAL